MINGVVICRVITLGTLFLLQALLITSVKSQVAGVTGIREDDPFATDSDLRALLGVIAPRAGETQLDMMARHKRSLDDQPFRSQVESLLSRSSSRTLFNDDPYFAPVLSAIRLIGLRGDDDSVRVLSPYLTHSSLPILDMTIESLRRGQNARAGVPLVRALREFERRFPSELNPSAKTVGLTGTMCSLYQALASIGVESSNEVLDESLERLKKVYGSSELWPHLVHSLEAARKRGVEERLVRSGTTSADGLVSGAESAGVSTVSTVTSNVGQVDSITSTPLIKPSIVTTLPSRGRVFHGLLWMSAIAIVVTLGLFFRKYYR